ncbi:MAG TPA: class I SAM-dependent methyltransferase [Candidatus Binataceae bacterium]|nr:class I SAM-dependent methyltransferase [Candidatus Binataceae bacterium]
MNTDAVERAAEAEAAGYFAARLRLLNPPWDRKRLTYREVRRAGWQLAGNPHDLRLFGLHPIAWYLLGARILGRTAVEVTRDTHAEFLAKSVAETLALAGITISDVIDPFVGSGNLLFHIQRATRAARAIGIDVNADVMELTKRNFARLRKFRRLRLKHLELLRADWGRAEHYVGERPTLILLHPPWGEAFDVRGLDLRRTTPPMAEVLERFSGRVGTAPTVAMLQLHPLMVAESVDEITRQYHAFPTMKPNNPEIARRVDYLLLRLPAQVAA